MESLAYTYLAVACEDLDAPRAVACNWQDFSGAGVRYGLAIALGCALISVAQSAQAALKQGDRGAAVAELQQNLTALGVYKGPISGFYGELTRTAVAAFQRSQGLTPDGIVGTATRKAMQVPPTQAIAQHQPAPQVLTQVLTQVLSQGASGQAVTQVQQQLQQLGYWNATTYGYFGGITEDAVRRFQAAAGLAVDGRVGDRTQAALNQAVAMKSLRAGRVLRLGSTGQEVRQLQEQLQAAGFDSGVPDGQFDERTQFAVVSFQLARGIDPDGIVGAETAAQLQRDAENR